MASARTSLKDRAIGVCGKLVCINSRLCGLWSAADLCLAEMPRKRSAKAGASMPEKSVAKVKSRGSWVLGCLTGGGGCFRSACGFAWGEVPRWSFVVGGCENVVPRVVLKRWLYEGLLTLVCWGRAESGAEQVVCK